MRNETVPPNVYLNKLGDSESPTGSLPQKDPLHINIIVPTHPAATFFLKPAIGIVAVQRFRPYYACEMSSQRRVSQDHEAVISIVSAPDRHISDTVHCFAIHFAIDVAVDNVRA